MHLERAVFPADGTRSSAVGTGLLLAQGLGLLFQERLQGALGESGGGSEGDLLHGGQIDVEPGPVVAKGASGDDFAPLSSEATEFVDFLGSEVAVCHVASCLGVETTTGRKQALVKLRRRT
jgi:hypothetical protein